MWLIIAGFESKEWLVVPKSKKASKVRSRKNYDENKLNVVLRAKNGSWFQKPKRLRRFEAEKITTKTNVVDHR